MIDVEKKKKKEEKHWYDVGDGRDTRMNVREIGAGLNTSFKIKSNIRLQKVTSKRSLH